MLDRAQKAFENGDRTAALVFLRAHLEDHPGDPLAGSLAAKLGIAAPHEVQKAPEGLATPSTAPPVPESRDASGWSDEKKLVVGLAGGLALLILAGIVAFLLFSPPSITAKHAEELLLPASAVGEDYRIVRDESSTLPAAGFKTGWYRGYLGPGAGQAYALGAFVFEKAGDARAYFDTPGGATEALQDFGDRARTFTSSDGSPCFQLLYGNAVWNMCSSGPSSRIEKFAPLLIERYED